MTQELLEALQNSLPPYLAASDKRALLAQLKRYPDATNFFGTIPGELEPVQGDAWRGLVAIDFDSGERDTVLGIVMSNSCDITRENKPEPDQRLLFAPLIDLGRYIEFLHEAGKRQDQIDTWLTAVRRQEIHRIFYLPAIHGIFGESIALLDAVHSQPMRTLTDGKIRRVFSLSLYGWYVFLIKLSIHFTRMQEDVPRTTS